MLKKYEVEIKGSCENCGFAYKGLVETDKGVFRRIKCPSCKEETMNFDDSKAIAELDKAEGLEGIAYKQSTFEYIGWVSKARIKSLMETV